MFKEVYAWKAQNAIDAIGEIVTVGRQGCVGRGFIVEDIDEIKLVVDTASFGFAAISDSVKSVNAWVINTNGDEPLLGERKIILAGEKLTVIGFWNLDA